MKKSSQASSPVVAEPYLSIGNFLANFFVFFWARGIGEFLDAAMKHRVVDPHWFPKALFIGGGTAVLLTGFQALRRRYFNAWWSRLEKRLSLNKKNA